jgi:hypothetical protein
MIATIHSIVPALMIAAFVQLERKDQDRYESTTFMQ